MRLPLFLILLCVLADSVAASDRYPYLASIAAVETPVLSGPGSEHYSTSQLRKGEKVEVYYETEDWCAIRPPIGSFSWISARYVDLGTNGIGTVIADGLAARIGSENTELCETVQVKLKKGEKVLVIGRLETPENSSSPLWYKIAPPSGEFRWIPRNALYFSGRVTNPGDRIVQVAYETETGSPANEPELQFPMTPRSSQSPRRTPPVESESTSALIDLLNRNEPVVVEFPNAGRKEQESPKAVPATTTNDVLQIPPLSDKLASSRPVQARSVAVSRPVDPVRSEFDRVFEELKEETRVVMTRPTEDWVFQTLIDRGNELYDVAPTDEDLEKVYHLVETLQRTWAVRKEIAYRRQFRTGGLLTPPPSATPSPSTYSPVYASNYARNNGAPAPTAGPRNVAAPAGSKVMPVSNTEVRESSPGIPSENPVSVQCGFKVGGFDVVGKLGEFESPPKGYPPYAVVDEQDRILCLISPTVGVEMKEHIGKTVGINGVLGFYEKNGQPDRRHIAAQEVEIIR